MRKSVVLSAVLLGLLFPTKSIADTATITLPQAQYEVVVGESQLSNSGLPQSALLTAIASWVSAEFGLPPAELPSVNLITPETMAALRYSGSENEPNVSAATPDTIVALYDTRSRTISLPNDWSGRTPSEISILVHEMVHHLQSRAGLSYACPAEREELAYLAQERFLALFDKALENEFDIDPLTRLVRTRCGM